ncbi:hypothetical protein J5N97_028486 [Dioscorea zingiberensis]|uniref:Nuclear matrix constituent protein 1-like protein n=1 Tax=Dioscorea zingiberensis TaxID=325984 RepID=A0A9D5H4U9_9LILI|nr:hypothetical protein J5N97_028486 [Dioscorea zingiberensis]
MASPRLRATPLTGRSPDVVSGGDEAIWKRLREAGFDEESVRRRDKAALIAYITKLETEIYDYQYQMGILILQGKELTAKYENAKASADSAEILYKRDQAAHLSALAEAKKREEILNNALSIEKECVSNIEKALHDMRAESAEKKVAYESKLAEARILMDNAQKKFDEAENKLLEAETKHAEATRSLNIASRSLQDVEAREDDLRRRQMSFKSEYDVKEKEINLQKQFLLDGQKVLHEEQERLREGQSLLNQREEYIIERTKELKNFEKELEEAKANLDEERRTLKEEKTNLDLDKAALSAREEAVVKRESLLDKKEREILILQEKVANKEYDEIQRLADENQIALERKRNEFEAELERRRISFEEEMEIKCSDFKVRESELNRRENIIQEREKLLELSLVEISEKQEDVIRRLKLFEEKERILHSAQEARELEILKMLEEREEIQKMREDLEKMKIALEDKKEEISLAQKQLELTESERNDLVVLETKLKEEIDSLRAQKMELVAEADKLRAEKEKFEIEWELIDEKREELRKETERVTEERKAVSSFLKNEHNSIKLEKENLQIQLKNDVEALSREREEFVSKMEREHSEWFSKIQQERDDFVKDINLQREELENCIDKRREEIERYLKEKEEAFEQEKIRELEHINSQKEMIGKELEHVAVELKRLENERAEISLDREQREREWSEIKKSIEELNSQREKLQNQRELLHADRYEINQQIQQLKRLEELNIESENRALSEIKSVDVKSDGSKALRKCSNVETLTKNLDSNETMSTPEASCRHIQQAEKTLIGASPPASSPLSWLRKCTEVIFKRSPEKVVRDSEPNVKSQFSTKFGQVSARKEIKSLNSNLLDKEKTRGNGKLVGDADNVNGVNSSLLGRKRPSNILSQEHADMLEQPTWKLRKKMRQIESDAIEETTNKGASSIQVPLAADDCHLESLIHNTEWTEPPNGCVNDENELSKVSSPQPHEASQLILSQSKAHENGIAHGSEDLPHAGIGGLSSGSYINGIVKKGKAGNETIVDNVDKLLMYSLGSSNNTYGPLADRSLSLFSHFFFFPFRYHLSSDVYIADGDWIFSLLSTFTSAMYEFFIGFAQKLYHVYHVVSNTLSLK